MAVNNLPLDMLSPINNDLFGGIRVRPSVKFATQDSDETIYILARRHIITNFGWIFNLAVAAVLPVILIYLLVSYTANVGAIIPPIYLEVFPFLYYSSLFTYTLINLDDWYYNVILVTNKRIINYRYNPLVTYTIEEAELVNIQDVSQTEVGVIPSFFNYGDVFVETAGKDTRLEFKSIPKPTWFRNVLAELARLSRNSEP